MKRVKRKPEMSEGSVQSIFAQVNPFTHLGYKDFGIDIKSQEKIRKGKVPDFECLDDFEQSIFVLELKKPKDEEEDAYTSVGCKEVVEIPRLTPSLQRIFLDEDRTTLTVLRKIAENEVYESIEKLKEDTNLKRSTLKYHLDILEKLNFIEIVRKGKKSIIRITKLGKTYAKILVR